MNMARTITVNISIKLVKHILRKTNIDFSLNKLTVPKIVDSERYISIGFLIRFVNAKLYTKRWGKDFDQL